MFPIKVLSLYINVNMLAATVGKGMTDVGKLQTYFSMDCDMIRPIRFPSLGTNPPFRTTFAIKIEHFRGIIAMDRYLKKV